MVLMGCLLPSLVSLGSKRLVLMLLSGWFGLPSKRWTGCSLGGLWLEDRTHRANVTWFLACLGWLLVSLPRSTHFALSTTLRVWRISPFGRLLFLFPLKVWASVRPLYDFLTLCVIERRIFDFLSIG
jgi:hypothetical protein